MKTETPKSKQGFACLTLKQRQEVARKGGQAAQARGTGHQFTPEEARSAGRKGGLVSRGGRGRLPQAS